MCVHEPNRTDHQEPRWPYGGRGHRDPQPNSHALEIRGLHFQYHGTNALALVDVSLEVPIGERVALVGHNGAGKSTLLKCIAGLLRPGRGTIQIFGNAVGACHHRTAYLPQRAEIDWQFPFSVEQFVMTGRYVHLGWFQRPKRSDHERVHTALERLGLAQLVKRQLSELSGGQQQRVLIARALVQESSLFLLDEPLNAVDDSTRIIIEEVLQEHADRGGTVLVATHELARLSDSFDRAIYFSNGTVEKTIRYSRTPSNPARLRIWSC